MGGRGYTMIEQWDNLDAFQDSMGSHFNDREYSLALFMEVAELVDSLNWKPWRGQPMDRENLKRELIDVLFFVHHIARNHNITPEELRDKFKQVMKNNINRYSTNPIKLSTENGK